jgi:hypothetical protein
MPSRETRKGTRLDTFRGPMYQHHNVWISPFTHYVIAEIAKEQNMDENHLIGIIVEQFIDQGTKIDSARIDYFSKEVVPQMIENSKSKRGIVDESK